MDKKWATGPWLTLAGILLGAVAALVNMLRIVRALDRKEVGSDGADP